MNHRWSSPSEPLRADTAPEAPPQIVLCFVRKLHPGHRSAMVATLRNHSGPHIRETGLHAAQFSSLSKEAPLGAVINCACSPPMRRWGPHRLESRVRGAGLSLRTKGGGGIVTPTDPNVHGNTLCSMVKTWARHKTTETALNNDWRLTVGGGWRLAVGSGWRLAVGGWQLAVGGGWRLVILGDCPKEKN